MLGVDYKPKIVPIRGNLFKIVTGNQWIDVDGQSIDFKEDYVDRSYKGLAFPVPHQGVTYRNSDVNLSAALFGRCLGRRVKNGADELMDDEYDDRLRDNQKSFISIYRAELIEYAQQFVFNNGCYYDAAWENLMNAWKAHIKRDLRIEAAREAFVSGKWLEQKWGRYMTRIKLKLVEFAKNGKIPRCIGDLGCSESLHGAVIMEAVKLFMSTHPYYFGTSKCTFVKSVSHAALKQVFDDMVPTFGDYDVSAYLFSDDSIFSISYKDGDKHYHRVFCVDISKCDMSHTKHLFYLLRDMFEGDHGLLQVLIDQCIGKVNLFGRNMSRKIVIELLDYVLLSGSTLTTAINNLANYLIFIAVCARKPKDGSELMQAVEECGYVVTTGPDVSQEPTQWQFLKHSPVMMSNGEYAPLINLGPFFRGFGVCKSGDFIGPRSMPVFDRALYQQGQILMGMFGDGMTCGVKNPFLDHMRRRFNIGMPAKYARRIISKIQGDMAYKYEVSPDVLIVSDECLFERYFVNARMVGDQLCHGDIADLYREIDNLTYGRNLRNRVVARILMLDYDLGEA